MAVAKLSRTNLEVKTKPRHFKFSVDLVEPNIGVSIALRADEALAVARKLVIAAADSRYDLAVKSVDQIIESLESLESTVETPCN